MTWTYLPDFTKQRDRVRFEVGDTDSTDPLLQDEEIAYAASQEPDDLGAAARCCESLSKRFARLADMAEGTFNIKLSQRSKAFVDMAAALRIRQAKVALPYVGGESISDKTAIDADTDRVAPAFFREMMDNPGAEDLTPSNASPGDEQSNA